MSRDPKCQPKAMVTTSAIEALFRLEASRLTRFFARRLSSQTEAQDLTQDAFVRLARSHINGDPMLYLNRIARNLLIDKVRHDERWRRVINDTGLDEGAATSCPPEQTLGIEADDVKRQYQDIIDRLPSKTRQVYLLHRLENLSYVEIADRLDLSVKAVEYHISSALKALFRGLDRA